MKKKYKPGPGWVELPGPPNSEHSGVFENAGLGIRVCIGAAHLAFLLSERKLVSGYYRAEKYVDINGGNLRRGLMAWAASVARGAEA